jgi:hypothetical protein
LVQMLNLEGMVVFLLYEYTKRKRYKPRNN